MSECRSPPGHGLVREPETMQNASINATPLITARGLIKRYDDGRVTALDGLDLEVAAGEFVALCGPSGCGKSTLLNLIAAIDRPDAGTLTVAGRPLRDLTSAESDHYRTHTVGLIFQLHNLLPNLTALENIQVPLIAAGMRPAERVRRARLLLEQVGLADRADDRPPMLSGGERQRVAVARALANRPKLVLADEPTGALDSRAGEAVLDLLTAMRQDHGITLVVVTHDVGVAARADRVLHLLDGRLAD